MITSILEMDQSQLSVQQLRLTDLFQQDPQRFEKFSVHFDQLSFDYSKHRIDQAAFEALIKFADSKQLSAWIKRLFTEEQINYTEGRAAMHWALRLPKQDQDYPELAQACLLYTSRCV